MCFSFTIWAELNLWQMGTCETIIIIMNKFINKHVYLLIMQIKRFIFAVGSVDSLSHAYDYPITVFDWCTQNAVSPISHLQVNFIIKPWILWKAKQSISVHVLKYRLIHIQHTRHNLNSILAVFMILLNHYIIVWLSEHKIKLVT